MIIKLNKANLLLYCFIQKLILCLQISQVRAEAARLLGSLHQVSNAFKFQTLDKKLMSDLKVRLI